MSQSVPKVKPAESRVQYFDKNIGQPERVGKVIGDVFSATLALALIVVVFFHLVLPHRQQRHLSIDAGRVLAARVRIFAPCKHYRANLILNSGTTICTSCEYSSRRVCSCSLRMSAFGGKAEMTIASRSVRFIFQRS